MQIHYSTIWNEKAVNSRTACIGLINNLKSIYFFLTTFSPNKNRNKMKSKGLRLFVMVAIVVVNACSPGPKIYNAERLSDKDFRSYKTYALFQGPLIQLLRL